MYGWSFYGWDYSMENPTGATHRICGFVQAYTGNVLREDATEEQKRHAVELAGQMKDFPEEGSVLVTEDCVVVRLSEVKEQIRQTGGRGETAVCVYKLVLERNL